MRETTRTMNSILSIAKQDSRIRSAFQTGSRVNPTAIRDGVQDYDIIFFVKNVEEFSVDRSFAEGLDPIFIYSPEVDKKQIGSLQKEINYSVLLEDGVKIDFKFLPIEEISDYIGKNTLISLLMDKDNLIDQVVPSSDVGFRVMRPTKNEFDQNNHEFFYRIIEVLPYIYRGQETGAKMAYRYVEDSLLRLLSWHIGYTNDFRINLGKNYRNIDEYIEEDFRPIYRDAIFHDHDRDMWKAVFAALSLFRRLGLGMAERLNYEYPRKLDADIVSQVRDMAARAKRNSGLNM